MSFFQGQENGLLHGFTLATSPKMPFAWAYPCNCTLATTFDTNTQYLQGRPCKYFFPDLLHGLTLATTAHANTSTVSPVCCICKGRERGTHLGICKGRERGSPLIICKARERGSPLTICKAMERGSYLTICKANTHGSHLTKCKANTRGPRLVISKARKRGSHPTISMGT